MAKRSDQAAEIATLQAQLAELRHRLERLEDFVGLRQRGARPRMAEDETAPMPEASIEPGEPWNLGRPGKGPREP